MAYFPDGNNKYILRPTANIITLTFDPVNLKFEMKANSH